MGIQKLPNSIGIIGASRATTKLTTAIKTHVKTEIVLFTRFAFSYDRDITNAVDTSSAIKKVWSRTFPERLKIGWTKYMYFPTWERFGDYFYKKDPYHGSANVSMYRSIKKLSEIDKDNDLLQYFFDHSSLDFGIEEGEFEEGRDEYIEENEELQHLSNATPFELLQHFLQINNINTYNKPSDF